MLTWLLLMSGALAADCPTDLANSQAALGSAAVELENAAAAMETLQAQVDLAQANVADAEDDLDEAEDELDDAVELLALLRGAALANPKQPVGDYATALNCFFDESACPVQNTGPDGQPVDGLLTLPDPRKKGLFPKK